MDLKSETGGMLQKEIPPPGVSISNAREVMSGFLEIAERTGADYEVRIPAGYPMNRAMEIIQRLIRTSDRFTIVVSSGQETFANLQKFLHTHSGVTLRVEEQQTGKIKPAPYTTAPRT